jgi:hypothetical protein
MARRRRTALSPHAAVWRTSFSRWVPAGASDAVWHGAAASPPPHHRDFWVSPLHGGRTAAVHHYGSRSAPPPGLPDSIRRRRDGAALGLSLGPPNELTGALGATGG